MPVKDLRAEVDYAALKHSALHEKTRRNRGCFFRDIFIVLFYSGTFNLEEIPLSGTFIFWPQTLTVQR